MALITDNTTKIKFYTGAKASYNEATHGQGVYFCNDFPYIHANGVWTGVSDMKIAGKTLAIKTGEKFNKSTGKYEATTVSINLSSMFPTDAQISNWNTAYNFVSNISGTDTDTVINKWQEIVDFLANISSSTDLSSLLAAKANSSTKVIAGTGLTGGGELRGNVTLSLAAAGTSGTYVKVSTDQYGRVTSGSTAIAISEVTNLQTTLDAKVPNTRKIITNNPLSVDNNGVLSKDLTLSLKYVTSEFKVETSGANVGLLQLNAVPQSKVTGLTDALNAKLEKGNIIAGDGINVTTSDNNVTIAANLYAGGALATIKSSEDGVGGIAIMTDEITITKTRGSLAINTSRFVVNGLTSDSTTTALSAKQGKVLDGKITTVSSDLASAKVDINTNALAITNINTDLTNLKSSVSALETQLTWVVVS